jgi:16S rRNA C1402 (ribose-2'-O) methylase RsmI
MAEVLAHFEENEPRGEFVIVVEGLVREKKKSKNVE